MSHGSSRVQSWLCETSANATLEAKLFCKEKSENPTTPHDIFEIYTCDSSNKQELIIALITCVMNVHLITFKCCGTLKHIPLKVGQLDQATMRNLMVFSFHYVFLRKAK